MQVKVLFFAQAREHAGASERELECGEGDRVSDLLDRLVADVPALSALRPHLAVAINGELVRVDARLIAGGEVALLPPVSGG